MSEVLRIVLVRHAETAWTVSGQHTGRTDLPLTPAGEWQARTLAPRLAVPNFQAILSSPLQRARQTCRLAGLIETEPPDPDLAEWDYGDYEAKRSHDIRKTHPHWNVWNDGCPHGESPDDIAQRADRLIGRISHYAGTVALFTHGQFAAALAMRWIGLGVSEGQHFALAPASVSELVHDDAHPAPRLIAHWNG